MVIARVIVFRAAKFPQTMSWWETLHLVTWWKRLGISAIKTGQDAPSWIWCTERLSFFWGGHIVLQRFVHVRCHFQPLPTKLVFAYFDRGSYVVSPLLSTEAGTKHKLRIIAQKSFPAICIFYQIILVKTQTQHLCVVCLLSVCPFFPYFYYAWILMIHFLDAHEKLSSKPWHSETEIADIKNLLKHRLRICSNQWRIDSQIGTHDGTQNLQLRSDPNHLEGDPMTDSHGFLVYLPTWNTIEINHSCMV